MRKARGLMRMLRPMEKACLGQMIRASTPFPWRNGRECFMKEEKCSPSPEIKVEMLQSIHLQGLIVFLGVLEINTHMCLKR